MNDATFCTLANSMMKINMRQKSACKYANNYREDCFWAKLLVLNATDIAIYICTYMWSCQSSFWTTNPEWSDTSKKNCKARKHEKDCQEAAAR